MVAFTEADRFQHGCKNPEFRRRDVPGELAPHALRAGDLLEPDSIQAKRHDLQTPIHVGYVANGAGRPEALRDGCGAGPDTGIYSLRRNLLSPHADFSTQDEFLLPWGKAGIGGNWISHVVICSALHCVKIVRCGEDSLIARGSSAIQRFDTAP